MVRHVQLLSKIILLFFTILHFFPREIWQAGFFDILNSTNKATFIQQNSPVCLCRDFSYSKIIYCKIKENFPYIKSRTKSAEEAVGERWEKLPRSGRTVLLQKTQIKWTKMEPQVSRTKKIWIGTWCRRSWKIANFQKVQRLKEHHDTKIGCGHL